MAVIYWRLGHLTFEGVARPLGPFVIFRQGEVFDVDGSGWDRGIRPGQPLQEMKWRHPGAALVPWHPTMYEPTERALQQWLTQQSVAYTQRDVREGWWEWPNLTSSDWRRMSHDIVPRWAQRVEAGIASHPLLAEWAAKEGSLLALPEWDTPHGKTYVLHPTRESSYWAKLPLTYVPDVEPGIRKSWHKRGWHTVGEVPGLLSKVRQYIPRQGISSESIVLVRTFDDAVVGQLPEILTSMAEELYTGLYPQQLGIRDLRITWHSTEGLEVREREWPQVKGDRIAVVTRVLSLLHKPPKHAPEKIQLEVAHPRLIEASQMAWWDDGRKVRTSATEAWEARLTLPRRERLLQYWDVWRMRTP